MGIADSIIEMAFGALVIGGAAAAALGLGGREAATRVLEERRGKPEPNTALRRMNYVGTESNKRGHPWAVAPGSGSADGS